MSVETAQNIIDFFMNLKISVNSQILLIFNFIDIIFIKLLTYCDLCS